MKILTPSMLAVALCASIGATANAQAATVTHVTTSPGVGVTIISQPDAAATLVHASFILRAGLDRQTLTQNGLAALTAQTILRTPVDGKPVQGCHRCRTAVQSRRLSIRATSVSPSKRCRRMQTSCSR